MRSLNDVTETEMRDEYDKTPAINQYVPWAEVLANSIFSTILKNQVISQEEKAMQQTTGSNVIFLAREHRKEPREFIGIDLANTPDQTVMFPAPEPKKMARRSTITLHQGQIEKIKTALTLSRNCLKFGGMSDVVRNEALDSLAESQKIIQSFYEPRA
jgi:hypothetical protein